MIPNKGEIQHDPSYCYVKFKPEVADADKPRLLADMPAIWKLWWARCPAWSA